MLHPRQLLVPALVVVLAACAPARSARPPAQPAAPAPVIVAQPDELPPPDSDAAFDAAPSQPARPLLTLGMTRPVGRSVADASQAALDAYLSQKLGGPVVTRVFDSPISLAAALVDGEIEAAWMTPLAYIRAAERATIVPVVKLSRGGFTTYRSVIFAKKGRVRSLRDLKGKRMAWVGRGSASGRLFPEVHLRKLGTDPGTFFSAQIEGSDHREVCLAVLNGAAEAGATLSDEVHPGQNPVVDGCREAGLDATKFQIVERTDPIPNDVIAARKDLPQVVVDHFRDALLELGTTPEGIQETKDIFQADGFASVIDEDFSVVREMEATLARTR